MDECLPNAEELIESEAVEGCLIALYLFDTTGDQPSDQRE